MDASHNLGARIMVASALDHSLDARHYLSYMKGVGTEGWSMTHLQFAAFHGFSKSSSDERVTDAKELAELVRYGQLREPPISTEELDSRGKSHVFIKIIALLQILWFGLQTLVRAIRKNHTTTALEISVVAYMVCYLLVYGLCWNLPKDVEYAVPLHFEDKNSLDVGEEIEDQDDRSSLDAGEEIERRNVSISFIVLALFAAVFGALHCLAWNLPFPTSHEKLLWRISAISTTVLGPLMASIWWYWDEHRDNTSLYLIWAVGICYSIVRIMIIVLSFTALRALPDSAYQTISWSNYMPHLGI